MRTPFTLALAALLGLAAGSLAAASPEKDKPVLPPGPPVVLQMPGASQWSVDYVYADPPPAPPPGTDPFSDVKNLRPVRALITKSGDVRHEEWTFGAGLRQEVWAWGLIVVKRGPKGNALSPGEGSGSIGNAFPELDWLSPDTFAGFQVQEGKKLLAFRKEWFDEEHKSLGVSTALVDPDTRYPVFYEYPPETRRYTILAPPQGGLAVPPEFIEAGKEMAQRVQSATPQFVQP